MKRGEKIALLNSIRSKKTKISDLDKTINVRIWEDIPDKPGYYLESVTGRISSLEELREEYSQEKRKGISIFWCDPEWKKLITNDDKL